MTTNTVATNRYQHPDITIARNLRKQAREAVRAAKLHLSMLDHAEQEWAAEKVRQERDPGEWKSAADAYATGGSGYRVEYHPRPTDEQRAAARAQLAAALRDEEAATRACEKAEAAHPSYDYREACQTANTPYYAHRTVTLDGHPFMPGEPIPTTATVGLTPERLDALLRIGTIRLTPRLN